MKLWRVYNGSMGFSAVHRIVVADTKQQAEYAALVEWRKQYPDINFTIEAQEIELVWGMEKDANGVALCAWGVEKEEQD